MQVREGKKRPRLGAAVDLGTTSMAFSLFDLDSGCRLSRNGRENPLSSYGADVLSRLEKSINGEREAMQRLLSESLQGAVGEMVSAAFPGQDIQTFREGIGEMVVAGNTAMLSLLTGQDVRGMEVFPFRAPDRFGTERTDLFPAFGRCRVYLPRCISAFLGADLVCALVSSRLAEQPLPALLLDIGTNGEIALQSGGHLRCTSVPAGPAFEAVHLSCGMPAGPGALVHVSLQNGIPALTVQGGGKPRGFSGSAALDLLELLRREGLMDPSGQLLRGKGGYGSLVRERNGETVFTVPGTGLYLSQEDIRALQTAKAAVRAAVDTLLAEEEIPEENVKTVILAGAFGSSLSPESMAGTGLLPQGLAGRCIQVGNAALAGAEEMLLHPEKREAGEDAARRARAVSLLHTREFAARYIRNMSFT